MDRGGCPLPVEILPVTIFFQTLRVRDTAEVKVLAVHLYLQKFLLGFVEETVVCSSNRRRSGQSIEIS